ncbi:MAG: acetoacetate--CoA ligase [Actinobacteria bacterium]|nr:acetoacetate--CoA ligase [Actinomycetota bacterium]MBU1944211.1 acetoacetate--CoA ligase [Actinomycetota bacterium]MBU2688396.1 acetoacetate--CoA ligase [Actinomycetota bacterium]
MAGDQLTTTGEGELLWSPSEERVKSSNMYRFIQYVNERFGKEFTEYEELYRWSVEDIADFWSALWDFTDVLASRPFEEVIEDATRMPGAKWFAGARLNFAENLLRFRDDREALVFKGEGREPVRMTYAELYDQVARLQKALKEAGVGIGDRVAGFMPNMPSTVVAMLAATAIGATWSSCSPDFGIKGVLDRFGQIKPKVLFVADGYYFKGGRFDSIERVAEIIRDLPSVEKIVVSRYTTDEPDLSGLPNAVLFDDFKSSEEGLEVEFEQLPFDHPVFIMYSSGTTGLPKCMVQCSGGILLHHLKELILHTDLNRDDTIFYFTTCGWMMWNWLVSSLAVGARIILFDGNPFHPDAGALWDLAEKEKITVFGISAGYIAALMKSGLIPKEKYDLSSIRAILSTGSPLSVEGFHFVYDSIKEDVQLASISGGTDINGCFALGNPMLPVYAGELQCRGLGMAVEAFNSDGRPVYGEQGELVCTAPSPSMPIYFWEDPGFEKYRDAYFSVYPGVWRHGDFIVVNEHGGVAIYGRSDATLNPGGVRIGTAEIYRPVENMPEIEDSLVVGQHFKDDVRVILFVKVAPGYELDDGLRKKIKKVIREAASPRHVPAKIIEVQDVPYTLNMKKVELAVKNVIEGKPVKNKDALKNPESLDYYADLPELEEG